MSEQRPTYGNPSEKTFEELVEDKFQNFHHLAVSKLTKKYIKDLLQLVRETTIAEAVEFCVSQDWIKTIDNLKRLPKDRIYDFEKPKN